MNTVNDQSAHPHQSSWTTIKSKLGFSACKLPTNWAQRRCPIANSARSGKRQPLQKRLLQSVEQRVLGVCLTRGCVSGERNVEGSAEPGLNPSSARKLPGSFGASIPEEVGEVLPVSHRGRCREFLWGWGRGCQLRCRGAAGVLPESWYKVCSLLHGNEHHVSSHRASLTRVCPQLGGTKLTGLFVDCCKRGWRCFQDSTLAEHRVDNRRSHADNP